MEEHNEDERILFCRAVANMIAADHVVTEDERAELNGLILAAGLSPLDPRVEREVFGELTSPGPIADIVGCLKSADLQHNLFRVLVEVAAADGKIADSERNKVKAAASTFGLNASAASELLDWTLESLALERREQEILARLGL